MSAHPLTLRTAAVEGNPQANHGAYLVMVNGLIEMAGNAGNNLLREFLLKRISNRTGEHN